MIKVGMLRQFRSPNNVVLAAALAAKSLDMEFFFFNPQDIDFDLKTISGLFYENGQWVRKSTDFPDVVDNGPVRQGNREVYSRLRELIPFTTNRIGNKDKIYQRLYKELTYRNLLIPTKNITQISDIKEYLAGNAQAILKPRGGNRGRGIYFAENCQDHYIMIANKERIKIEADQFDDYLVKEIDLKEYILQPYIKCRTKDGLPFDIRIHVRRDLNANWQIIKIYPRVGTSDGIVSNLSQGGYIGKIDNFLKRQFGDEHTVIKGKLINLAKEFPVYFQKGYADLIDALGIDIGIDEKGKLWMFEVNSFPGCTFFELEAQINAMGYAKYLALHKNKAVL